MKRTLTLLVTIVMLMSSVIISSAAPNDIVYIYAPDGRTSLVMEYETEYYQSLGWYPYPVITMYAADGRETIVRPEETEYYQGLGWYTEPVATLYNIDGSTNLVFEREVEYYQSLGWYTQPLVTMYNRDGGTNIVFESEVEYYKTLGWLVEMEYEMINGTYNLIEKGYYKEATSIFDLWLEYIDMPERFENDYNAILDRCYEKTKEPIIVESGKLSLNSMGIPKVEVEIRNISPKKIVAFDIEFTCYDAYGDATTDYPRLYNGEFVGCMNRVSFNSHEDATCDWTLNSNSKTTRISRPRVTRVAFEDGSTWYNK